MYTANVCKELQGLCGGFLQYLQGKPRNIYRFPLQSLQSCKYYRVSLHILQKTPCRVPAIPCKHLQCTSWSGPKSAVSHALPAFPLMTCLYGILCVSLHVGTQDDAYVFVSEP